MATTSTTTHKVIFGQILVDYSNGAFPLLPSGGNDTTPPSAPPVVRDGAGADQSVAVSTTQLSANWEPASDAESGIKGYQYAIGSDARRHASRRLDFDQQRVGGDKERAGPDHRADLLLQREGHQRRGTDRPGDEFQGADGGHRHDSAQRAGRRPRRWNVRDLGARFDSTTATTELTCNFDPATDPESGIGGYQFAIGTRPGATDAKDWSPLAANAYLMYVRVQGLKLTPGQRYYFAVRAINGAGLTGPAANSDGQTVVDPNDTTPPSAPAVVRNGTGADIATTTSTTQLSANWDACTDPESGISGYQYAIGTTPGGNDVANWTKVPYTGPITTVTRKGLNLSAGKTYYFSVRAVNGKGLVGSATNSKGQQVVGGG